MPPGVPPAFRGLRRTPAPRCLAISGAMCKSRVFKRVRSRREVMMDNPVVETDILVIGSGPAGLAFAIHYMDLARQHGADQAQPARLPASGLVLEKGGAVGDHTRAGAIVNPAVLRDLLPDVAEHDFPFESPVVQDDTMIFTRRRAFRLPFHPPYMSNKGNSIVALGKLVRWMSRIAERKGVEI